MFRYLIFLSTLLVVALGLCGPAGATVFTSTSVISGDAPPTQTNKPLAGSPAAMSVSGMEGEVTDANVLFNVTSVSDWSYFDWMLMSPDGIGVMLASDCGSYNASGVNTFSIFFDQSASQPAPTSDWVNSNNATGTYRPNDCHDFLGNSDEFPGVLPSADLTPDLNRFNGVKPNGTWRLFAGGSGASGYQMITVSGWSLELKTSGPRDTASPTLSRPSVSGKLLGYRLSEAATLNILVDRVTTGVRTKAKKCVKKTKSRKGKSCKRFVPLPGRLTTLGTPGDGTYTFDGRLAGKKLSPGKYRFTMTATDAAGNVSAPMTYNVTIKKPKTKKS